MHNFINNSYLISGYQTNNLDIDHSRAISLFINKVISEIDI